MVALIPECDIEKFDFRAIAAHFRRALPSYAVPKFLRLNSELECTPTHKIKKVDLKQEGFDPGVVGDAVHVLLPGDSEYTPLTPEVYSEIQEGKYRF
jgi:citronellyl-CoA synthetase